MNMKHLPTSFISEAINTPEKRDIMADEIIRVYNALGIFMNNEDRERIRASLDGMSEKLESGVSCIVAGKLALISDWEEKS